MWTVSMAFLQLPNATTAATIVRVKDTRHHLKDNNSDEIVEITIDQQEENISSGRQSRLRKRHSENLYLQQHLDENSNDLEWLNPCGGLYAPSNQDTKSSVNRPSSSYYLRNLRRVISREFHTINDTMNAIEINNMKSWSKYQDFYTFLPKLNLSANVKLKRWYRHIQIFTASFAYLGRAQYKYDDYKLKTSGEVTRELDQLLTSARSILCEIETTINGSYPFPLNQNKLTSISREAMNEKLSFLTKLRAAKSFDQFIEPATEDLRFVKSKYYHYLLRMWRSIHQHSKRNGQKRLGQTLSLESSKSLSATIDDNLSSFSNEIDASLSRSQSSASESFEFSSENRSQANNRPKRLGRPHRRHHKANRKSAELPQ